MTIYFSKTCNQDKSRSGFTLVELSIILLIIGLIIGGITVGGRLVANAALQKVIKEYNSFYSAIEGFRLQYNWYPGDMPNAYSFFSSCGTSAAACNGNGNGVIEQSNVGCRQEPFMAWTHLDLSGYIPGNYTGSSIIYNCGSTTGVNTPASSYSNGQWFISMSDPWYQTNVDATLASKHTLAIGAPRLDANSFNEYPLFSPADARTIDSKMDDAMPYTGKVKSLSGVSNSTVFNCIIGSGITATYNLTATNPQCWMWFLFD